MNLTEMLPTCQGDQPRTPAVGVHSALCKILGIGDGVLSGIEFQGRRFCLWMGNLAMDSKLRTRISGIVKRLAEQEQQRLRAAGTFVELEELACEIGDEVTQQLMAGQLAERSDEVASSESQECPDCGQASSRAEMQHRQLDSLRGKIEYDDPAYHCPTCRRAFSR